MQAGKFAVTKNAVDLVRCSSLDAKAERQGKRVMGQVEAKAGPDSELARTLRKLGAKP
jgi:hypothetical protein